MDPEVAGRLAQEPTVWMCTLRPDGSPHLTPVWFVYRQGTIWVGSDATSVKVRNVSADPRVSFALEDGNSPVVGEGRAVVHHRDFPPEVVAAFAVKFGGWDVTLPHGGRVLFETPVSRWLLAGTAQ